MKCCSRMRASCLTSALSSRKQDLKKKKQNLSKIVFSVQTDMRERFAVKDQLMRKK